MRFLHVSDLHLGRRLYGISLEEEQAYMLNELEKAICLEQPQAILITGDVFDKAQPSTIALTLAGRLMEVLAGAGCPAFVTPGNHDNPQQIAWCKSLLKAGGVHVTGAYQGRMEHFTLEDEFGPLHLWMLPFVTPAQVRRWFPEEEISTFEEAVATVLAKDPPVAGERNILLAHQFVCGGMTGDSEALLVGGVEEISTQLFGDYDLVALGHLHRPQSLAEGRLVYAGSPYAYSFGEKQEKTVNLITLEEGPPQTRRVPLPPLRILRRLEGTLKELTEGCYSEDYIEAIVTDEQIPLDVRGSLLVSYPRLAHIEIRNSTTNDQPADLPQEEMDDPMAAFEEFYTLQNNGTPPGAEKMALIRELWAETEAAE